MNTAEKLSEPEQPEGWHPEDIKAAVRKRGWTFYRLAKFLGYSNKNTAANVLYRQIFEAEQAIGDILEVDPAAIWPERYQPGRRVFQKQADGTVRRRTIEHNAKGRWFLSDLD